MIACAVASIVSNNSLQIGTVIQDTFRVEKQLGEGGMGAVYLAEHLRLKKKVAIKCLHPGFASNPEVIRRFKNEAVAASSIGHPHIINVLDMGQFSDGTFFMVLEFLDGKDWQHELDQSGAQAPAEVAHIGLQICAALGAAAAKGIVHRDIKPENIFLIEKQGDKNFVKVLDFGISKILDGTGSATKTGALMGTPHYMSPEQVLGKKDVTHLADIYALGVIFFQALSGRVPFEGETLAQIILKIANEPAPSLALQTPEVPPQFCRLVGQMMEKEPSARPQTFEEVATQLLPFLSESSPLYDAARGAVAASSTQKFGSSRRLHLTVSKTAGMVAVAVILLVGSWFVLSPTAEDKTEVQADTTARISKVHLRISTVPADAKLFLDGKALENPFDGEFDKDTLSHELSIRRDGFEPETRKMLLTADQNVVIPLTEKSEEPPRGGTDRPGPAPAPSPQPASGSSPQNSPSQGSEKVTKPIRNLGRSIKNLF